MQTRAKLQNKNKNWGSVSISNDYNSPKCAYIISGEGYIEWNDFTSDTLYTTTTPTKERNIYRSSSISERGLYGARELPIFYLDGKIMARQSIVWGVCAYGGLFPHPAIYIYGRFVKLHTRFDWNWLAIQNEWTGPKNIQKNTCPDVLDNSMDHRI